MKYAPDEGWAWAVTFAGFVVNLVVTGAGRMSAILYVALMDTYGVSRKQAITPFTTRSAVKSLLGPVVGILGQHYGVRVVIISGAATALLGLILCFFTQDILWITVYYGVLTGYFRDTLGSYDGVFLTVAAVISVMGIMWLILPRVFTLKVEQEKKIDTEP